MGEAQREREGGRVVLLVLLVLALLAGGGYAAAYVAAADRLPRGTTVAGVAIGGRTAAAAEQALRQGLAPRADAPLALVVDGHPMRVAPARAGLGVDYAATVDQVAVDRSWDPAVLWDHWTGGRALDPVVTLDRERLGRLLARIDATRGRPATDGAVRFAGDHIVTTAPRPGRALDTDGAAAAIRDAYLRTDAPAVDLPLRDVLPAVDDADVRRALDEVANPAVAGAVTLVLGGMPHRLQPREFAPALRLVARDGTLVLRVDGRRLARLVTDGSSAVADARVELVDGRPRVVPSHAGVTYRPQDLARALRRVVTRPEGRRQATVEATVTRPRFTTQEARALGITERVASAAVPDAGGPDLEAALAAVDRTVLRPGRTLALDRLVGADPAADVRPLVTAVARAMQHAGLTPVGATGTRFRDDTAYGVLVEARLTPATATTPSTVTVRLWSTR